MSDSTPGGPEEPKRFGYRGARSMVLAGGSSLSRFVLSAPAYFIGVPAYLVLVGAEQYGIWVLITTFTGWLYFMDFGLKTATMRLAGRFTNDPEFELADLQRSLGVVLFGYALVVAAVFALLAVALPWVLGTVLRIPERLATTALVVVGLGVCGFFIDLVSNGVYRAVADGLGYMTRSNAVAVGYTYVRLALIVLAAWTTRSVQAMAVASLAASVLGAVAWRLLVRRIAPFVRYRPCVPTRAELAELVGFSGIVQINDLIGTATPQVVEAILVRRFGLESLGLFDIGVQLSIYLRLTFFAVLAPVMPWLAGRQEAFRRRVDAALASTQTASNFVAIAGLGGLVALAWPALTAWLPRIAEGARPPVLVLAAMGVVQGTGALYVHKWNADGRPERTTLILAAHSAPFIIGAFLGASPLSVAIVGLLAAAASAFVAPVADEGGLRGVSGGLALSVVLLGLSAVAAVYFSAGWAWSNLVVGGLAVAVGAALGAVQVRALVGSGAAQHAG